MIADTNSKFIVFDGLDGSGKGTQLKLLSQKLGGRVVFTREPGGSASAEEIRFVVRTSKNAKTLSALAQFLLFWASREDSMEHLIMPALGEGKHVFDDRGDSSTWAFQIRGEEQKTLISLFHEMRSRVFLCPGRRPPDLYVFFEVPPEVARSRVLSDKGRDPTHFDLKPLSYYERVAQGFREFGKNHRAVFINGDRGADEIHEDVCELLREEIGFSETSV